MGIRGHLKVLGKDISKNDVGFKGQLDGFRMYDRAISSEEVKGLFNLVSSKNPKIEHVPYTFTVLVKTGNGGKADGTRDLKVKLEVLGLKDSIKFLSFEKVWYSWICKGISKNI